jgi:hypothetical protein
MASKVTGRATVFGFGATASVSFTGAGTFIRETAEVEHNYQLDALHDDDNEQLSLAHSGEVFEGTLVFTPIASSGTNTLANAKESLRAPAKGSPVTLANFPAPAGANDYINKSDWVYIGGFKVGGRKNGFWSYTMKIRRSPNNDLSTQPS